MSAPSEFVPGTRVRGRNAVGTSRIGHVVDAPLPKRFDGQQPAVMVLWEGQDSARPMYTFVLQALPPRTYSILTIEIPIHHPAGAKASDLAESLLDGVINSDAWMLYQGQDPEELEGEPGLYVDEVPFSAAIRSATLTEPGVQS